MRRSARLSYGWVVPIAGELRECNERSWRCHPSTATVSLRLLGCAEFMPNRIICVLSALPDRTLRLKGIHKARLQSEKLTTERVVLTLFPTASVGMKRFCQMLTGGYIPS
jgi:hypothetical protein